MKWFTVYTKSSNYLLQKRSTMGIWWSTLTQFTQAINWVVRVFFQFHFFAAFDGSVPIELVEQNEHAKQNWADLRKEENTFQSRFVYTFTLPLFHLKKKKIQRRLKKRQQQKRKKSPFAIQESVLFGRFAHIFWVFWLDHCESHLAGGFFCRMCLLSSCDIRTNCSETMMPHAPLFSIWIINNMKKEMKQRNDDNKQCLPSFWFH